MTPTNKLDSAYVVDGAYDGNEGETVWLRTGSSGYYAVKLTPEWTYYEFAFMPARDFSGAHAVFAGVTGSHHNAVPIDIDNAKLWYYEDGERVYITENSFDEAGKLALDHITSDPANRNGHFFLGASGGGNTRAAAIALASEYDYEKIGATDGEASVTYTFELTPGLYTVTGDARLDYYNPGGADASPANSAKLHSTYMDGEDNTVAFAVTATIDGETIRVDMTVTEEWSEFDRLLITVPAGTQKILSEITLTFWLRGIPDSTGDCGKLYVYINYPISSRKLSSSWGATHYKGEYELSSGSFILDSEWQEYVVTFAALDTDFALLFEGGRTSDHSRIFDIAGLSLTFSDDIGNPIGDNLIENWENGWSAVPYGDETDLSFEFIDDYVYRTARGDGSNETVLTYETDETFSAGKYTVSGKVRLGNREDSNIKYKLTEISIPTWLSLVASDRNKATLTATVGDDEITGITITNEWKDINFTFTLDADGVPELKLSIDEALDLDFADLKVTAGNK